MNHHRIEARLAQGRAGRVMQPAHAARTEFFRHGRCLGSQTVAQAWNRCNSDREKAAHSPLHRADRPWLCGISNDISQLAPILLDRSIHEFFHDLKIDSDNGSDRSHFADTRCKELKC
jgi:hypothetical protein